LLGVPEPPPVADDSGDSDDEDEDWSACPCCGGRMIVIETFEPGGQPRTRPTAPIGIDSS
jgi:hypothetical protein